MRKTSAPLAFRGLICALTFCFGFATAAWGQASPVSVSPNSGTGNSQTFQLTYTDPGGAYNFRLAQFDVVQSSSSPASCMVVVDFSANVIKLNANTPGWISLPLTATTSSLQNNQCSVSLAGLSISRSGTILTISLPLTFTTPFAGAKQLWMSATNCQLKSTGLVQEGVWTVPAAPPITMYVTPGASSLGGNQTQQFQASVGGTTNTAVSWSVNPAVGTISASGLYTAPGSVSSQQTVTVIATSAADNTVSASAVVTLNPPVTLGSFYLPELFGATWPDQPIEFRYDGGQPAAGTTRMMLSNGTSTVEVPFQWVSSCSDNAAVNGCIAVRSSLPANSGYTWTLQSGAAPVATPTNPVQLTQVGGNYEMTNGLTGVRIPASLANPFNVAPIEGILLPGGVWTGAGASPNLMYAEALGSAGCVGCILQTPMSTATSYSVTVTDQGPLKTVIKATYTFNRPAYFVALNPPVPLNTAGTGHYTIIVTMYANSKSILIDEDSDMQFSYYLPLYAQLQPDQVRLRAHSSLSSSGIPSAGCGYEAALTVSAASSGTPIVITAAIPAVALANGQAVTISGVQGNTAANGNFYAKTTGFGAGQFALYTDASLTQAVAANGSYAGGGVVKPAYRGQNLTPTPDAYQDLTYGSDRPASYICSTNAWPSYRKLVSDYPAAAPTAAWYDELYQSTAGTSGAVVGIYTGRASKQVYSALGPSMPGIYTSNSHFITGAQAAGIQLDNRLLAPTLATTPLVHRNWGIFVSTQADLLSPGLHQPIADEQNMLTGINLSRLYTYQLAYPDPPGGWNWEYLSTASANQLISLVQNGTPLCGSVNCYYNLLHYSEGSVWGTALLNMWQGNSTAAVQTALNTAIQLAQTIVQVLATGDNHFDDAHGYYQLGLSTSPETAVLNAILMNPNTTPAQATTAKAILALFGCIFWDDDWFPVDNESGEGVGLVNQIQQYLQYRAQSAAAAPSQPFLSSVLATSLSYPENDFSTYFSPTGAAAGSTQYQSAFFEPLILNYQNLTLDGVNINGILPMADPKWAAYANWELSIQTPPEPRFGGSTNSVLGVPLRKGYSNGDGNTMADVRTGMLGTALKTVNPTLAGNLMWMWQQSNSPTWITEDAQFVTTLAAIDPTIPQIPAQLGSINIPGYHSAERANFGTPNETALWFINGGFYQPGGHRHFDDGQVSIYAHAAPLAIDWNANNYNPDTSGRFMHNSIVYDSELAALPAPHLWSADQPGLTDVSTLFNNPTNTEFAAFQKSTTSSATFAATDGTVWTRSVRMMNFNSSYPIIYVKDTFAGASAGTGKTLTWNLMAAGAVSTPAGSMTPTTRFSSGCQSPAGALPSTSNIAGLNTGLNHFNFTGFTWPKHATGGINWDLYAYTADGNGQFIVGNWGHGCHTTREVSEYQVANGTSFAEVQDILRVHDTGPFETVILPYRKTETPTRTVTQQACGIQIVQGAETTCFNDSMASYAGTRSRMITTYDASTQSAFGFTTAGGPQEVTVTSNQIVWTISGVVAGTRTLTLPGRWYSSIPLQPGLFTLSGSTYSYNFPGLPPAQGGQDTAPAQPTPVTITFSEFPHL